MTFDRYLLRSFLHVFVVCFITSFGLMVVIDLFENLDEFIDENGGKMNLQVVQAILQFYGYRAIFFFDQGGAVMAVASAMVVLILFQRNGELHPLLAAGISMYRLLSPLVAGVIGVSVLLIVNQEFVVPRFSAQAFENRGTGGPQTNEVEAVVDHSSMISIGGDSLQLAEQRLTGAIFTLPAPLVATELTVVSANSARFLKPQGRRPAGWLLEGLRQSSSQFPLTEFGKTVVVPLKDPGAVFVATAISGDQLYKRNSNLSLLSMQELVTRIRCPAFSTRAVQQMIQHLHTRLMQPAINVIAVLIVIPLMVRRESVGIVVDSALCGGALTLVFGVMHAFQQLGSMHIVGPELAAWAPVVFGGTLSAWLSGSIRT